MPEAGSGQPYRVLARKYRPQTFGQLIGQDAMVRTLSNGIESGRLAHAFILTGVRGVGKTTTARIIARALNCVGPDGTGRVGVEPCGACDNCRAIADDRHVDVLEMDAASRTGVDDIRELIDGVRYLPVQAHYKIYIIDEVHMLSRNAFNALLKTLEEPPDRVVFIFATTEIRKVPVTVLSRCQRFDLNRVDAAQLIEHFRTIAEREDATVEDEALALIARAAEGSVRDGLSLLDQAIAHGGGPGNVVAAEPVRAMLGLADRARVIDLFDRLMAGDIKTALAVLRELYDAGADPTVVLQDLLELSHWLTTIKLVPAAADDVTVSETERLRGREMAARLEMPTLARCWQMLLKGLNEARMAPSPISAAEMVLVRLAYAADLPEPGDLVRRLDQAGTAGPDPASAAAPPRAVERAGSTSTDLAPAARPAAEPAARPAVEPAGQLPQPESFEAVVALFGEHRELILRAHLMNDVSLVDFDTGRIELRPGANAPRDMTGQIAAKLTEWTGRRWVVSISRDSGAAPLAAQQQVAEQDRRDAVDAHPLVQAAKQTFPGAEIRSVRQLTPPAPEAGDPTDEFDGDQAR